LSKKFGGGNGIIWNGAEKRAKDGMESWTKQQTGLASQEGRTGQSRLVAGNAGDGGDGGTAGRRGMTEEHGAAAGKAVSS
jgi:hypothetical protein